MRAEILQHVEPQRRDRPIAPGRELDIRDLVTAVVCGLEALGPGLDPLHRPLEHHSGGRDDEVLRVGADLDAKGSTNLRRDYPDLVLAETERLGDIVPAPVGRLRRGPDDQPAGCSVWGRDDRPSLHRDTGKPLAANPLLHHDRRAFERVLDLPLGPAPAHPDVVFNLIVELWRAGLAGLLGIDHGREQHVVHVNGIRRVTGGIRGHGNHRGDRLSHVADRVGRHRVDRRLRDFPGSVRTPPFTGR